MVEQSCAVHIRMSCQKTEGHSKDANLVHSSHVNVRLKNDHEQRAGLGSRVQCQPMRSRVKVEEHEARVSALERGILELREQVATLVGTNEALKAVNVSLQEQLDLTQKLQDKVETLDGINDLLKAVNTDLEERLHDTQDRLDIVEDLLGERIRNQNAIHDDLQNLTRAVAQYKVNGSQKGGLGICTIKKPERYDGSRHATVIDNFVWDIDDYFKHDPTLTEAEKVNMALSYLTKDAKLWWRFMEARMKSGAEEPCKSWDQMKQILRKFFRPSNADYEARKRLKNLRQTGSIRDYIQSYLSIMLEIPNMSNEEMLFNFKDGLQTWARHELNCMRLETLAQAIAAAENLIDYKDNQGTGKKVNIDKDGGRGKKRFKRPRDGRIQ